MQDMDNVERTVAERVPTDDAPAASSDGGPTAHGWSSPETAEPPSTSAGGHAPREQPGPAPVPSVAALRGHPIHPMVVPLPIGALSLALASDLAYAATGDRFWARSSSALVAVGIVGGAVAAAFGATDFLGRERIRRHPEAWLHAGGNLAAMALSTLSLAVRRDRPEAIMPAGLALSALTGGILLVTGWLGGELSYRHRIGVMEG